MKPAWMGNVRVGDLERGTVYVRRCGCVAKVSGRTNQGDIYRTPLTYGCSENNEFHMDPESTTNQGEMVSIDPLAIELHQQFGG